ncbi:Fe(II)-2OG oxygenase family protein [Erwinia billingiae]|uniref:TauD/TfdA family dioxygenase n=1 Tax=Erwinia billingiae TaxID=182337 RepID=UPI000674FA12|nr:TauD/TfdA family dioxygenase [Erwinia billingiae]
MLTIHQRYLLEKDGYVFIPEFLPNNDIISCGKIIGEIIAPLIYPNGFSAGVFDTLIPKNKKNLNKNTYSAIFGFADFPFHTDLAHTTSPPQYLLLRCVEGAKDVKTHILSSKSILENYDNIKLKKSIFKSRDNMISRVSFPLPLVFDGRFIRWDSVFLEPVNKNAEDFYNWMSVKKWEGYQNSYSLLKKGDTLIINNWKSLHSRSSVSEKDKLRIVERIYLSEIW